MVQISRTKVVLRNVAFVTVASFISQLLLGVTGIFLIRYLGLGLYSEYSTAALYMGMFTILGKLGFNQVFLREGSRDISMAPTYFGAAMLLNGSITFLGLLVALMVAYFRYDSRIFVLTMLLGTSAMLMSLRRMSTTVFQVHQKMHFAAIVSIAGALLYAIAFFFAMNLKASIFVLAGLHLGMSVFSIMLSYSLSFRLSFPILNRVILKKLMLVGRHFCVIDIMLVLYARANGFILALLDLKEQVGIYNAAFRIFALIQIIAQVIGSAISPAIYGTSGELKQMTRGLKLAIRYFVVSGMLIGVILVGRAEWLMTSIFKVDFAQSANILKFLGIAMIFRFMVILFSHVVYANNKERFMMVLMTCVAILSVGSCLIVVPLYGAIGAAIIFLVSEMIVALMCLIQAERQLGNPGFWKLFILPLLSALAILIVLKASTDWPILGLIISPCVFFGLLLLTGYYRKAEVISLARMFIRSH